jgi:hypothetical protein
VTSCLPKSQENSIIKTDHGDSILDSELHAHQTPHRHNEFRDELANLASGAFIPLAARSKALIQGGANENVKTSPNQITNQNIDKEAATGEDERGDLLIRGFWTAGADCVLDVCVTDTDAKSCC